MSSRLLVAHLFPQCTGEHRGRKKLLPSGLQHSGPYETILGRGTVQAILSSSGSFMLVLRNVFVHCAFRLVSVCFGFYEPVLTIFVSDEMGCTECIAMLRAESFDVL